MAEQVQPLILQKTTNLEEHQQFFAKINEIIDNLAPTVAEAEAATATANQAIADAETAIGNANTAIGNANAAVSTANAASAQAQAAAGTVAGYNARLTEVEDTAIRNHSAEVQVIDSDVQVVDGHDLAVAGDVNVASQVIAEGAEIANMAIEKSGSKTVLSNEDGITVTGVTAISVENTATGIRTAAAVNGTRLRNDLDAYEPMVRTTGNQTIGGNKTHTGTVTSTAGNGVINKTADFSIDTVPDTDKRSWFALMRDSNNNLMVRGYYTWRADGTAVFTFEGVMMVAGTVKGFPILQITTDTEGNVVRASVGGNII